MKVLHFQIPHNPVRAGDFSIQGLLSRIKALDALYAATIVLDALDVLMRIFHEPERVSFDEKQKTGEKIFPPWALLTQQVALTNIQVNCLHSDVMLQADEENVVAFDTLVIQQLEHDDSGNLSIAAVDTDSLAVHESGFVALDLNAARVHLKNITSAKMKNLAIDMVAAENMQLHSAGGQQLDLQGYPVANLAGSCRADSLPGTPIHLHCRQ